ncbi:SDR family oxidoreductase [Paenibacillus sp. SI8]|uniref:SDR family oxidoreductase n=1 Tax=unclassified Paenibacillus TaxID=185978 RepID=UPI00346788A8
MTKETTTKQTILITGASSGMGFATALHLARLGHAVFAGVRDIGGKNTLKAEELASIAKKEGLELYLVELDVTIDNSIHMAVQSVVLRAGRIDVLINNAGIMYGGITEAYTVDQIKRMMETNYFGPMRMNRAVLPYMRQQGSGLLIQISSLAGGFTVPFFAHYSATKMAVEALAEGYFYELAPLGIDSVLLEPGPFGTGLLASQDEPEDQDRIAGYADLAAIPQQMYRDTQNINESSAAQDPLLVAEAIAGLIAMAPGTRPLRTVPGSIDFGISSLNQAKLQAQRSLLDAWGLKQLVPAWFEHPTAIEG